MKEKEDKKEGTAGSTTRKVKNLQKQYNKILMDLFTQYAPECIECALEEVDGAFGQNIDGIVARATEELKSKVLKELGVETGMEVSIGAGPMGGLAIGVTDEVEDTENLEHEAEETPEEEAEERESGEEDEEEEETEDEEKE